jgi:hypothetical protein
MARRELAKTSKKFFTTCCNAPVGASEIPEGTGETLRGTRRQPAVFATRQAGDGSQLADRLASLDARERLTFSESAPVYVAGKRAVDRSVAACARRASEWATVAKAPIHQADGPADPRGSVATQGDRGGDSLRSPLPLSSKKSEHSGRVHIAPVGRTRYELVQDLRSRLDGQIVESCYDSVSPSAPSSINRTPRSTRGVSAYGRNTASRITENLVRPQTWGATTYWANNRRTSPRFAFLLSLRLSLGVPLALAFIDHILRDLEDVGREFSESLMRRPAITRWSFRKQSFVCHGVCMALTACQRLAFAPINVLNVIRFPKMEAAVSLKRAASVNLRVLNLNACSSR